MKIDLRPLRTFKTCVGTLFYIIFLYSIEKVRKILWGKTRKISKLFTRSALITSLARATGNKLLLRVASVVVGVAT